MGNAGFANCYGDDQRAASYAKLAFARTYYLAYRDLPALFRKHAEPGVQALDFGCGTGRSTRFLQQHGFPATGIDISEEMVRLARQTDAEGDYRIIPEGDFSGLERGTYGLMLSAFTFDNILAEKKPGTLRGLRELLTDKGRLINLVSAPEIYWHEWASFSTRDFPENRAAKSGEKVKIIVTDADHPYRTPVEDILCTDESYRELYAVAGLDVVDVCKPLATGAEPYDWISETTVAPWVIYVLARRD